MIHYLPSWNGDFRLEGTGESTCALRVVAMTLAEREVLRHFLEKARAKKWVSRSADDLLPEVTGNSYRTVELAVGVAQAGKLLLSMAKPKNQTLTAVRFENGRIETAHGAESKAVAALLEKAAAVADAKGAPSETSGGSGGELSETKTGALSETNDSAVAAVSVARPTPCCPECVPGSVAPASEVLLAFLDDAQHEQWAKHRAIIVRGQLSGHRYRIAHRNSPIAVAQKKICWDLDDDALMHFHDWSVPPEEEVLAAMLWLAHAEPGLRNEATALGGLGPQATKLARANRDLHGSVASPGGDPFHYVIGGASRLKYKNPFGGLNDGIVDAAITRVIGTLARGLSA